MNLIIDIGNTFVKLAVFENDSLVKQRVIKELKKEIIDEIISEFNINCGVFISVRDSNEENLLLKNYNFLL